LLPVSKPSLTEGKYDIYPCFKINDNQIFAGFEALAEKFKNHKNVSIDGYNGAFFELFQSRLGELLRRDGRSVSWINHLRSDFTIPKNELKLPVQSLKKASLSLRAFILLFPLT